MISIRFASRLPNALLRGLALFALAGLCGCATLTFKSTRQSRFINMDGEIVHVDYGKEKRTETMPNGLVCTYDGKVRLQLPDGKRVVLYQALTASGVRYVSQDKHYVFIEKGPYCMIYRDNKPFFEGVFCRK
jgi:uncharacterized OsmC-like protein